MRNDEKYFLLKNYSILKRKSKKGAVNFKRIKNTKNTKFKEY